MLNDPEEEHDCFADNTHNSHFYDALGIRNVYLGMLERENEKGEALIMGVVNAFVDQTRSIERAVAILGVDKIELKGQIVSMIRKRCLSKEVQPSSDRAHICARLCAR